MPNSSFGGKYNVIRPRNELWPNYDHYGLKTSYPELRSVQTQKGAELGPNYDRYELKRAMRNSFLGVKYNVLVLNTI